MDTVTRARIASHTSWGKTTDRAARTAPGRAALHQKFIDMVPAEVTDPAERERAGQQLKRAHFLRLAAKSAESRARNLRARAEALEAGA